MSMCEEWSEMLLISYSCGIIFIVACDRLLVMEVWWMLMALLIGLVDLLL